MRCGNCEGGSTELRQRVIRSGAIQIVHQCTTCGWTNLNPVARAKVPNWRTLPEWDDSLRKKYAEIKKAEFQQARAEDRAAFFEWYDKYLKTPEWAARRAKVLERSGGLCEGCMEVPPAVVHHLTYTHVGRELLYQLVALCQPCHDAAHLPNDQLEPEGDDEWPV